MGGNELKYVKDAFETNWISPAGPHITAFEKELADYLGNGVHVAALSSGTAAIHLALIMLGVTSGDEVICQSFTFAGSSNPILYLNAHPVFIDSEKESWNMDPEILENAIEDRIKKTGKPPKAIITVELYGMPAKLKQIQTIATKYNIPVIEDSAEALGSEYRGAKCGTFGEFGILSFNGNKIITSSGGGALVSRNEELIKKARFLATQARDQAAHYQHSEIGFNYRLSNVCAGIGRGQLEILEDRVKRKREIFQFYYERLNHKYEFLKEPEGFYSNRWLTSILINDPKQNREDLRIKLEDLNIESRPLWKPMHLQPLYEKYPFYGKGVCERLFDRGLCLPSGTAMKEDTIDLIINVLK